VCEVVPDGGDSIRGYESIRHGEFDRQRIGKTLSPLHDKLSMEDS
jgi:hypothetical protein